MMTRAAAFACQRATRLGLFIAWFATIACGTDPSAPSATDTEGGSSGAGASGGSQQAAGQSGAGAGAGGGSGARGDQGGMNEGDSDEGGPDQGGSLQRPEAGAPDNDASGKGGSVGADAGRGSMRTGALRIMPLGDSTTGSVCWRAKLWQKLNQNGFGGKFDFVGTRHNDPGCNVSGYDQDNEGHPSVLVTKFIEDADDTVSGVQTPQELLGRNPADVVLFHFATNDIWNGVPPATILSAYSTVLAALRKANPQVVVLVAKLIPMDVTANTCSGCSCDLCPSRITTLNDMIPGWASTNSSAASPIVAVDQWTGFNAAAGSDTRDGVHPNDSGSQKLADRWFAALSPWF